MAVDSAFVPALDVAAQHRQLRRLALAEAAPWLHQEVARRMAERLSFIREAPQSWVDWWGGLGGGAKAVAAVLPKAKRQVAEPTPTWVERSREQAPGRWWSALGRSGVDGRVMLDEEVLPGQTELVWANMVLHACPHPAVTMAQWHAALKVGGFLMFSTFGPDTLRELREVYAEHAWPAPHPPFADMHNLGDQLVQSGFADPVMDQEHLSLNWSSPGELLAELRGLGGHMGLDRTQGLRTPRWRDTLHDALARRADASGRIHLSFEVVYGHAYKAPPKPRRGDPVTVSMQSLRSGLRGRHGGDGSV